MKKVLYYLMLLFFFACTVWNALSKRDSIMGAGPAGSVPSEWVRIGGLHQGASAPEELRVSFSRPTRSAAN